jgi:phosphopantetheinyl transferase (holo-ACP synthase)
MTVDSAGVDLADERRLGIALHRRGPDLVRRIFTACECAATSADPETRLTELTAIFGVKESVVKVLGGLPPGSRYRDIVVAPLSPDHLSAVRLEGVLADWAERREVTLVAAAVPVADRLTLAWAAALTARSHQ